MNNLLLSNSLLPPLSSLYVKHMINNLEMDFAKDGVKSALDFVGIKF